jgi:hypothetical protein
MIVENSDEFEVPVGDVLIVSEVDHMGVDFVCTGLVCDHMSSCGIGSDGVSIGRSICIEHELKRKGLFEGVLCGCLSEYLGE